MTLVIIAHNRSEPFRVEDPGGSFPQLLYRLRGMAADIVIGELDVYRMALLAEQIDEFRGGGMGIYPDTNPPFIHVDVRDGRARWAKLGGRYVALAEGIKEG